MSARPKVIYFVEVHVKDGEPMRYAEKGGGKFTQVDHALARIRHHLHKGREATLYRSVCEWEEVTCNPT